MQIINAQDALTALRKGEKRALGQMLIDNIWSAVKGGARMNSKNVEFLGQLHHDAMNRYTASGSNFSFWVEAREIATWINSLS